jgi:hypothetical protein
MPDDNQPSSRSRERHVTSSRVGNETQTSIRICSNRGNYHEFFLASLKPIDGGDFDTALAGIPIDTGLNPGAANHLSK